MTAPATPFTVNITLLGTIALLKVALIGLFMATAPAPLPGVVERTEGGVLSTDAAVVKVHVTGDDIVMPVRSFTPLDTVTVYVVPGDKLFVGVKVAVMFEAL